MGLSDLTAADKEVIKSYAENDMNGSKTAVYLYMHINSIDYHLAQVKKKTGLNPRVFFDLVELLDMLREGDTE